MAERDPDLIDRINAARGELLGPDGYLPVLLLLLASTLCGLLIGHSHVGAMVSVSLNGAALLTTVFRSTRHTAPRAATLAFVIAFALIVTFGPRLTAEEQDQVGWLALTGYVAVIGACLPLVLIRALQHRRVTINTLCATVSAYLLIGLLFAGIYRLYNAVSPPFFAQDPGPAVCRVPNPPAACPTSGQYSYFSFITLSTVGYGDLSPGTDPARALVTLQAVTGQVFVITALARVVSLLGEERRPARPAGD